MKQQVLFIHGAGEGAYDADKKLADSLQAALGTEYSVRCPQMIDEDALEYEAWKTQIFEEIAEFNGKWILVGHSFGAAVLLKCLSEAPVEVPISGLFLIAAPNFAAEGWKVDDYALQENFAARLPQGLPIFLYHSRDDEEVPFAHLAMYAEKLPQATLREFDGRGHQFNDNLSDVAADIVSLQARQP